MQYLRHDDKLVTGKVELLDGVSENDLGETVGVYLRNQGLSFRCQDTRTLHARVCSHPLCRTS